MSGCSMVFILDGCSIHYAHTWSKSGISICWRHFVTLKVIKSDFVFVKKDLVFIIRAQREMSNHLIQKPWGVEKTKYINIDSVQCSYNLPIYHEMLCINDFSPDPFWAPVWRTLGAFNSITWNFEVFTLLCVIIIN